jgi:hypothetical protein
VGYANTTLGIGEFIRLKTRLGLSNYEASEEFLKSVAGKKSPEEQRAARFANTGIVSGGAAATRLEGDVLRFGDSKLTLFQEFAYVDKWFEDIRFSDKTLRKKTNEDVLSKPDRQTSTYGASLTKGLSGLVFSGTSVSDISGDPASFYREQRFDSRAWLGVRDIGKDLWNLKSPLHDVLAPSNAWVGYSEGTARTSIYLPPGSIKKMDLGLFWQWHGAYASVSAWRSSHTQEDATALNSEWLGHGADLSLGFQTAKWNFNTYASINRSSFDQVMSKSRDSGFNIGATSTFVFDHVPNLTFAFDVSDYGGADPFLLYEQSGRVVSLGLAADFLKYWGGAQKLQVYYYARKELFDGQWGSIALQTSGIDHVIGAIVRAKW